MAHYSVTGSGGAQACFCIGPQPGHKLCPCMERAKRQSRPKNPYEPGSRDWQVWEQAFRCIADAIERGDHRKDEQ